ncbi:hypothetical protein BU594_08875 [Staphylococcus arlettae]|uniref:hypothetical protein n=1 Tax=Staphylococcus arlettae TaxID=29378 RepID=UPI000E6820C8|nr:hypothetical protein [Staphylococcus arlettae]RIM72601.1 hypothetical protein BU594_08875 [Staphylococcus arlettae]
MKKFITSIIAATITLGLTTTPFVQANETTSNTQQDEVTNPGGASEVKEVNTYEEMINSKEAVSINPAKLNDNELEKLGLNPQQVKSDFSIEENGMQFEATKKWSKKISKGKITGSLSAGSGVIGLIGAFFSAGTSITVSTSVISILNGVSTASNIKGVQVGGTATKRLVRENPYQLPKKKWVYKATWAKTY